MVLPDTFVNSLFIVLAFMISVWIISVLVRDAGIADVFWGPGFILIAAFCLLASEDYSGRAILVFSLTAIWGLRLSLHIFLRNRGLGEDYRYANMRKKAGGVFSVKSLFTVFIFQGIIMVVVSMPLQYSITGSGRELFTVFDLSGLVLWLAGFYFEVVSDYQLTTFKADPQNKGKSMTRGLWALTRHPNYFGEFLMWWGLFIIALSVDGGFISIISPAVMSYLLIKVSGVPMLEKKLIEKPDYKAYAENTPAFFPIPLKKSRDIK